MIKNKAKFILKNCPKCGENFETVNNCTSKKFCSRKCANSRIWNEEDKLKKSIALKNSIKYKNSVINKTGVKKNLEKLTVWKNKIDLTYKNKILNDKYENLSFDRLRLRIIYEQECKCNKCKIYEWFGFKITLELEHKDGNHLNNKRDNLEALCPNCHSLTDTWRGRNKKNNKDKISDECLLLILIKNNFNMRQSLIEVGLSAKGGNYNRCHRLKKEFQLV